MPGLGGVAGTVDLGDLTGVGVPGGGSSGDGSPGGGSSGGGSSGGDAAQALGERVRLALGEGARRVQAVHAVEDAATAWACARAGLRREGVLRGVPSSDVPDEVRDLAVVAHVVGDEPPGGDVLAAVVPLFPTSLVSAGLVLRDPAGRVLLLRTSYKVPWEVPGGVVEDGEGLRGAAAREAHEELGLDLDPGRLLVLERRGADGPQPQRLLALLDGGVHDVDLPARCRFLDGEVLEAAWCGAQEVRARTGAGLATRVEAALARLLADDPAPELLVDGAPDR
ncbi:NUDIX hydrolase [Pseudokineococcus basanitobsidens]|uniref:NUDIX hydrolase n=1 Tax=Pseudokineococcus basanitobsidens TaxID=1926649 RepID=A0ABU8RID3_9ACTN